MNAPRAVCEECGYDLSGQVESGGNQTCPECGTPFYAFAPFIRRPWPFWPWVLLQTAGSTAALVAMLTIVGSTSSAGLTVVVYGWPVWVPAWVIAGIVIPRLVAEQLSRRCVLRPKRAKFRNGFVALGIVLNVAVSVGVAALVTAVL